MVQIGSTINAKWRVFADELDSTGPWRAVLLCVAPLLLCVGQYVSITVWRWVSRPTSVAALQGSLDLDQARDTAIAAMQNFELLCRESAVKARKEEGKRIAEQVPNTAAAEEFAQQINETQMNMADFAQSYSRAVGKLAQVDAQVSIRAMREAAADSRRAEYVDAVARDTQQVRIAPRAFNADQMSQSCADQAVKGS